jgi:hypothetical protein
VCCNMSCTACLRVNVCKAAAVLEGVMSAGQAAVEPQQQLALTPKAKAKAKAKLEKQAVVAKGKKGKKVVKKTGKKGRKGKGKGKKVVKRTTMMAPADTTTPKNKEATLRTLLAVFIVLWRWYMSDSALRVFVQQLCVLRFWGVCCV